MGARHADERNKQVIFKHFTLFTNCTSKNKQYTIIYCQRY